MIEVYELARAWLDVELGGDLRNRVTKGEDSARGVVENEGR